MGGVVDFCILELLFGNLNFKYRGGVVDFFPPVYCGGRCGVVDLIVVGFVLQEGLM